MITGRLVFGLLLVPLFSFAGGSHGGGGHHGGRTVMGGGRHGRRGLSGDSSGQAANPGGSGFSQRWGQANSASGPSFPPKKGPPSGARSLTSVSGNNKGQLSYKALAKPGTRSDAPAPTPRDFGVPAPVPGATIRTYGTVTTAGSPVGQYSVEGGRIQLDQKNAVDVDKAPGVFTGPPNRYDNPAILGSQSSVGNASGANGITPNGPLTGGASGANAITPNGPLTPPSQ